MTKQDSDNYAKREQLRVDALLALTCLYLEVPKEVANDINAKVKAYIQDLEKEAELTKATKQNL